MNSAMYLQFLQAILAITDRMSRYSSATVDVVAITRVLIRIWSCSLWLLRLFNSSCYFRFVKVIMVISEGVNKYIHPVLL